MGNWRGIWCAGLALALLACQAADPLAGPPGGARPNRNPAPAGPGQGGASEGTPVRPGGLALDLPARSNLAATALARLSGRLEGRVSLPSSVLSNQGGQLISDQGGAILGNNSGGMFGKTKFHRVLQASGVPSHDAAGGRRLLATAPVAGARVLVVDAAGHWVPDAAGRPYTATTDAEGRYSFEQVPAGVNLLLQVLGLPAAAGTPTAFLPAVAATAGQVTRSVDVDAVSTLTMSYIASRFVKGAQAVLDKLPGEVEADTRRKLAQAAGADPGVTSLTPDAVLARVDALRAQSAELDAQVRYVESLLVAGLSNMGEGRPATEVPLTSPHRLAVTADGQVFIAETWASRLRQIDGEGRIRAVVGGLESSNSLATTGRIDIGDGGAARVASLSSPRNLAVDASGHLYVSDWGNHRIRRIDAKTGVITTVAGSSPIEGATRSFLTPTAATAPARGAKANEAVINAPDGLAVDSQGRCVFASLEGTFRIEADGTLTPLLHDGKVVGAPLQLTSASDGQVFVGYGDGGFGRLTGDAFEKATDIPVRAFKHPWRLAAAPGGVLYMHGGGALHRFKDGSWRELRALPEPKQPTGLAANADHVWVSSDVEGGVWRYTPATDAFVRVGGKAIDPKEGVRGDDLGLSRPGALAFDAGNRLLLGDGYRGLIWRKDDDGLYRRLAGDGAPPENVDAAATGPALELAIGLATSLLPQADGSLVFSATSKAGSRAFQLSLTGNLSPLALPDGLSPLQLVRDASGAWIVSDSKLLPIPESRLVRVVDGKVEELVPRQGLAVCYGLLPRPDGSLYWTNVLGNAVYRRAPDGTITTVAGKPEAMPDFGGDGGPATEARLNWPISLAMDPAGHLYVADAQNHRVRRVDARTGIISTVAGEGGAFFTGRGADDGLREPGALAFDATGDLYIADSGHHQIKRIPRASLPQ